jgi:3-oxoadipate enol-lactonase
MPFLTLPDGCELYYKPFGAHPAPEAVVFLNGLSQTTLYWHAHARKVSGNYPVVCYDARAQGRSGTGTRPITLKQHTEDLNALLDHLNIDNTVLVGLSHGAMVACAFAATAPERTHGLFLCGAGEAADPRHKEILALWRKTLEKEGMAALAKNFIATAFGETFTERYRALFPAMEKSLLMHNRKDALARQLAALTEYPSMAQFIHRIHAPSRVLWGDQDRLVSRADARNLATRLGADFHSLTGVGHSLPVEAPEAFQGYLSDFLARPEG